MYPMLKEGVTLGTFCLEGSDEVFYYAENAAGKEFQMGRGLWEALAAADGTRPLALPGQTRGLLAALKRDGLLQTSRFVRGDGLCNRWILLPFRRGCRGGPLSRGVNAALPAASLLLFAMGVYAVLTAGTAAGDPNVWLCLLGLLASLALHEGGHLAAALACGYPVGDMGVLLLGVLPMGAYVAYGEKENASKGDRLQLALSGVEVNLLIAGGCFLAAALGAPLAGTLMALAKGNVFLAGLNLIPASWVDGGAALNALCEVEDVGGLARKWLGDRDRRKKLLRAGRSGYACLGLFAVSLLADALLWLLLGLDMVFLVSGFF